MLKKWFIWILSQQRLSWAVYNWIFFFRSEQWTILTFNEQKSSVFSVMTDISQDFLLSLILFLFSNVKLLEWCANFHSEMRYLEFVNDITLIVWEKSTENNCWWLAKTHVQCDWWARHHDMWFVSENYKLMHFIHQQIRHNQAAIVQIEPQIMWQRPI